MLVLSRIQQQASKEPTSYLVEAKKMMEINKFVEKRDPQKQSEFKDILSMFEQHQNLN